MLDTWKILPLGCARAIPLACSCMAGTHLPGACSLPRAGYGEHLRGAWAVGLGREGGIATRGTRRAGRGHSTQEGGMGRAVRRILVVIGYGGCARQRLACGPRRLGSPVLTVAAVLLAWWPAAVLGQPACTGTQQVFNFTGAVQTFQVPTAVTQVTIDAAGAAGGGTTGSGFAGGRGARLVASFTVAPGETLNIVVGGAGATTRGGWGGGGGPLLLPPPHAP